MSIPLSPQEMEKGYAKYFEMPYPPVPTKLTERMSEPMDPSKALDIHHITDMMDMDDAQLSTQLGFCIKDDGSGYVGSRTDMPGVTLEMLDWWFAWHGIESLRYKIWDPKDHYSACVSKRHLKQRMDTSLSWAQRTWNTTDFVVENVGDGTSALHISFRSPEYFGFDISRFAAEGVTATCAQSGPPDIDISVTTFIHFARAYDGGVVLHSRFWQGYMIIDKKPVRTELIMDGTRARALAKHCPQEYHRLAKLLPLVYTENAHIPQKEEDFVVMDFSR